MKTLLLWAGSVLLATTLPSHTTAQDAVPSPAGSLLTEDTDGTHYVIEFDGKEGTPLIDLLELAQRILDVPLAYDRDVFKVSVYVLGAITIARSEFRDFFDGILNHHGFVSWDAPAGEPPLITIGRADELTRTMLPPVPDDVRRELVPAEDLDREPARTASRYTTVFHLDQVDARGALTVIMSLLTPPLDEARTVADSNAVVVTSRSLATLRVVRDILQMIDVAPKQTAEDMERSLAALEQRLADLEGRLDTGTGR